MTEPHAPDNPTLQWILIDGFNEIDLSDAEIVAEHGRGAFVMLPYFLRKIERTRYAGGKQLFELIGEMKLAKNFGLIHTPMIECMSDGRYLQLWALSIEAISKLLDTYPQEFNNPPAELQRWKDRLKPAQDALDTASTTKFDQDSALPAIFDFGTGKLRFRIFDGEPWFVAVDAAAMLGYVNTNKTITRYCKNAQTIEDLEKNQGYQSGTPPENCDGKPLQPHTKMINRGDLNRLVVKSPLPAAVEFERLVFEEILVQIQVHGYYIGARTRDRFGLGGQPKTEEVKQQPKSAQYAAFAEELREVEEERDAALAGKATADARADDALAIAKLADERSRALEARLDKAKPLFIEQEKTIDQQDEKIEDLQYRLSAAEKLIKNLFGASGSHRKQYEEKLRTWTARRQLNLDPKPAKPQIGDESDLPSEDDTKH